MAHRILKRPMIVGGMSQLPRTLTSSVPKTFAHISVTLQSRGSHKARYTITCFVEAVARIAMGCEDDHSMSKTLQADSGINYKTLGTAYAKVRMEKDNCLRRCRHCYDDDHFPKAFDATSLRAESLRMSEKFDHCSYPRASEANHSTILGPEPQGCFRRKPSLELAVSSTSPAKSTSFPDVPPHGPDFLGAISSLCHLLV